MLSRNAGAIYYHRELLCHSLEQRRVDLITVSDCSGLGQEEPRFDGRLFPDKSTPRCRSFPNKQVSHLTLAWHVRRSHYRRGNQVCLFCVCTGVCSDQSRAPR